MKLFTTITSERGKPVTKSGNEYIEIKMTRNREDYFTLFVSSEFDYVELQDSKGYAIYTADIGEFIKGKVNAKR